MILNNRIKVGVLTSSRADYGIYKSLLSLFFNDDRVELHLIVFGMHLQKKHGETIKEIISDNYFDRIHKVYGMPFDDSKFDISMGYGDLVKCFSDFWDKNTFEIVFALGDRFEMSAAVQAGLPYELKIAHIHGGELSLGSIDNIYRDQISFASKIHFTSTLEASKRLKKILINKKHVYNVGSLSIDELDLNKLPNWEKVCESYNIPNKPFILITFHPETIDSQNNKYFIKEIYQSLSKLSEIVHLVITQANADNYGNIYNENNLRLKKDHPKNISLVNSFGKENYFSAINNSIFLLGNTSSGIIEAASFKKFFLNIGNRQNGRVRSNNTFDIPFDKNEILNMSKIILNKPEYKGVNKYKSNNSAIRIINKTLSFIKKQ
tara:strand:+ start:4298 stop:5431 length:1134 start_codon:yes stop_codon:yes gene_type:complete